MKYLKISLVLMFGLILGYFSTNFIGNKSNIFDSNEIRGESNYSFVNPLLECEQGSDYISKNSIISFKPAIQKVIDKSISDKKVTFASVYFRDLNNGLWFGINELEKFYPASLMKVPLLMYYLNLAEDNPDILDKKIEYGSGGENTPQFYPPKNPVMVGETYTVKELLEHTIEESDNNAALLLVNAAGKDKFKKIFSDLGISQPLETGENFISTKSYGSFFRILFNASYISPKYSESALRLLSEVKFKSGLVAKLPSSITVAHKFGEVQSSSSGEKQLHDCGIVYYPKKPYLICIMTRGVDFDSLASVISDISEVTYKEVDKQVK